jgi:hypothetical protein
VALFYVFFGEYQSVLSCIYHSAVQSCETIVPLHRKHHTLEGVGGFLECFLDDFIEFNELFMLSTYFHNLFIKAKIRLAVEEC